MLVTDLLKSVHDRQVAFAAAKRLYRDRLAPDFNPFDFIAPDEMGLSEILAWLLDPNGSHGQGARFLRAFLERIEATWDQEDCNTARVRVEASTDLIDQASRRIDVLVTSSERVLAIENKPWASDQKDQITDYLKQLDRLQVQETCLIYLSGSGTPPSEDSISPTELEARTAAGQLRLMAYKDLIPWLEGCRAQCRSDRVSMFLDDFLRFIQKVFLGVRDMTEREQLVTMVTQSPAMVSAAMQVIASGDAIKKQLLQTLVSQVQASIPQSWKLTSNMEHDRWPGLSLQFSERCKYKFRIEFERQTSGLVYGMTQVDRNNTAVEDIQAALTKELGRARSNAPWPWYKTASPHDRVLPIEANWNASSTPWSMIVEGTLHTLIVQAAEKFHAIMKSNNLIGDVTDQSSAEGAGAQVISSTS